MHHDRPRCAIQHSQDDERCLKLINSAAIRPSFCLLLLCRLSRERKAEESYRHGQSSTDKAGNPARVLRYQRQLRPHAFRVEMLPAFLSSSASFPRRQWIYISCSYLDVSLSRQTWSRVQLFPSRGGVSQFLVGFRLSFSMIPKQVSPRTSEAIFLSAYPYLLLKTYTRFHSRG